MKFMLVAGAYSWRQRRGLARGAHKRGTVVIFAFDLLNVIAMFVSVVLRCEETVAVHPVRLSPV